MYLLYEGVGQSNNMNLEELKNNNLFFVVAKIIVCSFVASQVYLIVVLVCLRPN